MNPHPQWEENFYELLGLGRRANLSEIASAYHQARNTYSKDSAATYSLISNEESQEMLSRLEKAYLTLSNIDKKREYDRWLDGDTTPAATTNVSAPISAPAPMNPNQPTDTPNFFQNSRPTAEKTSPSVTKPAPPPTDGYSSDPTQAPTVGPIVLTDGASMDGPHLKSIREKLGLTSEDVCRITKIPSRYLKAIEGSRPEDLPARVYLQGFIKNLAKLYHLDPKVTVDAYLATVSAPPHPNP